MVSAATVQALLLGSGGFLGTCMAGVGAYRLFSAAIERTPLPSVNGTEVSRFQAERPANLRRRPNIPNVNVVLMKILHARTSRKEPEKLIHHSLERSLHAARRDQRKSIIHIKTHLIPAHRDIPDLLRVGLLLPVLQNMIHQFQILAHVSQL